MKKVQIVIVAVLGVVFLGLAAYYWMTPAGQLAHFLPGYEAGVTAAHTKHALAALVLALGCGVLVWFLSGQKQADQASEEQE